MTVLEESDWSEWNAGFRPWHPWRGSIRARIPHWGILAVRDNRRLSHQHPWCSEDAIQTYMQRGHDPFRRLYVTSEVHFYRACPVHLDEVKSAQNSGHGGEILMCPHGHRVTTWVTMCSDGTIVGQAWKHRDRMVVGGREKKSGPRAPRPPTEPCERGHMDWTYSASKRAYDCASCKEKKSE